jgi:hypothetical protein
MKAAQVQAEESHLTIVAIAKMVEVELLDKGGSELKRLASAIENRLARDREIRADNEARIEELVAQYVLDVLDS